MIGLAASACYGNDTSKFLPGNMIAAASDPLWGNGGACGRQYRVSCAGPANGVPMPCKGGSVVVRIVDHCPGCGGTLDLSQEAFAAIANPVAGIIKINYQQA
ncbi:hypothetical protein SUGI_0533570 [Cryptomeria japonica]|nr:hypothetical protein SUGI_0533570 [Cryptomeria japonica]